MGSVAPEIPDRAWQLPAYDTRAFRPKGTRYCVCIPVLNEGERFIRQLSTMAPLMPLADVIVLDGGSVDGSTEEHRLRTAGVRVLLTKRGPGKLSAQLRMGYAHALQEGYDGVITIDGNGKDDPQAIAGFVSALDEGWDLVQGSRFLPGGQAINTPLVRLVAVRAIHAPLISLAAGFHYTDTTNGFRAYSRAMLLHPKLQPFREVFDAYELLAYVNVRAPRLGLRVKEIPVTRSYPHEGPTPTKITPLAGQAELLLTLLRATTGRFDPT